MEIQRAAGWGTWGCRLGQMGLQASLHKVAGWSRMVADWACKLAGWGPYGCRLGLIGLQAGQVGLQAGTRTAAGWDTYGCGPLRVCRLSTRTKVQRSEYKAYLVLSPKF